MKGSMKRHEDDKEFQQKPWSSVDDSLVKNGRQRYHKTFRESWKQIWYGDHLTWTKNIPPYRQTFTKFTSISTGVPWAYTEVKFLLLLLFEGKEFDKLRYLFEEE